MRFPVIFAAALGIAAISPPGQAQEAYRGVTVHYPPYMIVQNQEITGIVTDIVRAAFRRAGEPLELFHVPQKRALTEIRSGKSHLMFTLFYTEERATYMHYAKQPLSYEEIVLAVPRGKPIRYDGTLQSLADQDIGTPMGFSLGKNIDQAFTDGMLRKIDVPDSVTGIRMLARNRIATMASDRLTIRYLLKTTGHRGQVTILEPPLNRTPAFIGYSKAAEGMPALRDRIDQALKTMWAEHEIAEIISRYLD
ncbi:substrate-binding periplasmic protein [Aestuariispira insulae]|uniref:ABC-type amino acid transport substrate-binding protein n=1 Tax=Aestuariispira insulae TaxID=1461337 RepID=A0A3D9HRU3_9PROT|nr:transporter substrate-binding domain-containing protein [Aestuariispira insulae]RED52234.1 ABC-type amino acid transport substrate-binding protein [Aestuariispira insulae]